MNLVSAARIPAVSAGLREIQPTPARSRRGDVTPIIAPGSRRTGKSQFQALRGARQERDGVRLVLVGPPGCGKGTQADLLAGKFGIPKISSGDLFRARASASSQSHLTAGTLVPDEETVAIVAARLAQPDAVYGFVLDGFPRTLPQAQALDALLDIEGITLDGVLEFHLPHDHVIQRLSGRRTCPECARVWHLTFNPAPDDRCVDCGVALVQRSDDEPGTITRRLDVYAQQTLPVVAHYRESGLLTAIDAAGPVESVMQHAVAALTPIAG